MNIFKKFTMQEQVIFLFLSIMAVFIAALLFVNVIEFVACQYKLGGSFVGAILSPLFTSLPELIIVLVALFSYSGQSGELIGIGTIFGQPLMASCVSYGLVGITAAIGFQLKTRSSAILKTSRNLVIPFLFVTFLFPLALLAGFVRVYTLRYALGGVFIFAYFGYVILMYKRKSSEIVIKSEVPFVCRIVPHQGIGSLIQLIISVAILYFASHQLVSTVDQLGHGLGISVLGLSIIVIPMATAIPETASAIIWCFGGKDTLSIASLIGETIIYSTLYVGLGLILATWTPDIHTYLSVFITTFVSALMVLFISGKRIPWYGLCVGLVFFAAYVYLVIVLRL
jgi:cation:H+ antiporter